jgi:uncharacterized protein DUF4157
VRRRSQIDREELTAEFMDAASPLTPLLGHNFSRVPVHQPAPAMQMKLAINKPGDVYEQEANRVSEQVMRMPEPQPQGACPDGESSGTQAEQPVQESPSFRTAGVQTSSAGRFAAPSIVDTILHSPGQPLDSAARTFMDSRFGYDFSSVRVHTDQIAARSAATVAALAYTVGSHVIFGSGRYAPAEPDGQRLLAHELTHVVQQDGLRAAGPFQFHHTCDSPGAMLMRQPAPGPPRMRERVLGSFDADEKTRTIATVEVIGHASPRWRGARSPERADALNLHLAEKRALAVELAVEQILSDMVAGDVVFEPIVSTRMDEPDPLSELADVSIGHESRGSSETLKEAGSAGRGAHERPMLRVEVRVTLRTATETMIDEDIERTETKPGATKDWGIAVVAEGGIEWGIKGGAILILLKNNTTGQVGTYGGTKAGGGLGVGISVAKTQVPDFESMWTPQKMTFADFHGAVFTILSSGFAAGVGREAQTFWFRSFPNGQETPGGIAVGGFTFGGIGINFVSVESGVIALMDKPSETYVQTTRFVRRRSEVGRGRGTTAHKVFFPTASDVISPDQDKELRMYLTGVASQLR